MSLAGMIPTETHKQIRNQIKYAQSLCGCLRANIRNAMSRLVIWQITFGIVKTKFIMQSMKVQTIDTVYLFIGNQGDEQYLARILGQTNIHGFSHFTDSKEQSQTNNRPKQGNRKQRVHKPVGSSASI